MRTKCLIHVYARARLCGFFTVSSFDSKDRLRSPYNHQILIRCNDQWSVLRVRLVYRRDSIGVPAGDDLPRIRIDSRVYCASNS